MPRILQSICLITVAGETVMGTCINGFIALVNCVDWAKSRKLSLVNFLLMNLGLSRICLLWIMLINGMSRSIFDNIEVMHILGQLWMTASYSSISFVTCLNVFYFLKIAHFSHPLFLWLRWRINRVIFMILLGSLVIFLFLTLPLREEFKDDFIRSMERNEEKNHTGIFQMKKSQFIIVYIVPYLGPFTLLIMSLISCFLLILSLWRHTCHMHLNAIGSKDANTEAHIRVMGWMFSFIFLLILYYLGISISILISSMPGKREMELLGVAISGFYPTGHSLILILGNRKLKHASLWVQQQALFCLRGRKP